MRLQVQPQSFFFHKNLPKCSCQKHIQALPLALFLSLPFQHTHTYAHIFLFLLLPTINLQSVPGRHRLQHHDLKKYHVKLKGGKKNNKAKQKRKKKKIE